MNKAKHTEGPWRAGSTTQNLSGIYICGKDTYVGIVFTSNSEYKANTKLIEAAPELLQFIKDMAFRYANSEWIAAEANRLIKKATE